MKHTPGPWELRLSKRAMKGIAGDHHSIFRGGADPMKELSLASVPSHDHKTLGGGVETAEANARLMTASPKLLAACEAFREWLGASTNDAEEKIGRLVDDAIREAKGSMPPLP